MTTIVTRAGKGSPLTHTEVDTNFTNLNTNKLETAAIPLGTAAAPSVSFVSDANTGIFSPGADQVAISTNGVERVRLSSTGEFMFKGAGTTPGTDKAVSFNGSAPVNSMVLDSSGRLLVGTTNAIAGATDSLLQIRGNSSGTQFAGKIALATEVAVASIISGTDLGAIYFGNTANGVGGLIECKGDAQWSTAGGGDYPGRLVFSTTKDSFASPTEACRIDSKQNLLIGTTSNSRDVRLRVEGGETMHVTGYGNGFGIGIFMTPNASATSGTAEPLRFNNVSASAVGSITTTASATAFNTSSDYRLKENVIPVTDGITRLQQLNPSRFNFIADPYKTVDGFIAHEVQAIVPEAINGEKDAVDEEGNPQYQGIDQSKLVPLLTAALQEAIAKIETLEARLTAAGID